MRRGIAFAGLLLLGACGRTVTAGDQPDVAADQREKTAAKTLADLAAADKAARAPLPQVEAPRVVQSDPVADGSQTDDLPETAGNGSDLSPS